MRAMYHAMRPADIRPQSHLPSQRVGYSLGETSPVRTRSDSLSPANIFAQHSHHRPRDILAHLNPHLQ